MHYIKARSNLPATSLQAAIHHKSMAGQLDAMADASTAPMMQPLIGTVVGGVIPPLIPIQIQVPALIPINQSDYYRASEGMKEISVAVTSLMRHKDHFSHLMPFEHIYIYIQGLRRFNHSKPRRHDLMHMLSRYTQRYPSDQRDGIQYWKMFKGRHSPHEDPMP